MPLSDLKHLMEQAKKMQDKMKQAQKNIADFVVTGQSGGGLVKVQMNGTHRVSRVEISPKLQLEDRDMLEDLVAAAFNDATAKIEQLMGQQMKEITKNIQIPNDFLKNLDDK